MNQLAGNMRSRFTDFLTTDGEKADRHRDREFELAANTSREDIMRGCEQGWACVFVALDSLKPEDLTRTIYIRQEPHTVLQALNRALAHYAFHVDQIVFLAKHLRSQQWKTLSVPCGEVQGIQPEVRGRTTPKWECPRERAHPQGLASAGEC